MKIGLLTFHDGINHGGYFQAYSTYSFLRELGHDVEVINYKNARHWRHEYRAVLWTKRPRVLANSLKKIYKFHKDMKRMKLTRFSKDISKINTEYDVIVIGADVVWNYQWEFLGHDPVYFGHGLKAERLVSFSPSCGAVDKTLPIPHYVTRGLKLFSSISVRDINSADVVEQAIGHRPPVLVDPAFIYNPEPPDLGHDKLSPYMVVYAYQLQPEEIEAAKAYAKQKGLKTIALSYPNPWCDEDIVAVGPFEWLSYFKHAACVLTSTFHGTVFSLKFGRNFVVSDNIAISNKVRSILGQLGLEQRILGNEPLADLFDSGIDYAEPHAKLDAMINEAHDYLKGALDG